MRLRLASSLILIFGCVAWAPPRSMADEPAVQVAVETAEQSALDLVEQTTADLVRQIKAGDRSPRQMALLESMVEKSFEIQTMHLHHRLEAARQKIDIVEHQLEMRNKNAEKIMADRILSLVGEGPATEQNSDLDAEKLSSEGWQLWMKRDYPSALAKFEMAVAADPDFGAARNGLGWSQFHLQRYKAADHTFRDLLDDEPNHGGALNGLGQALLMQDEFEEAEVVFKKAVIGQIELVGEEAAAKQGMAAWHGLVRTLNKMGKVDEAIQWAERSLAHLDDPNMRGMLEAIEKKSSP